MKNNIRFLMHHAKNQWFSCILSLILIAGSNSASASFRPKSPGRLVESIQLTSAIALGANNMWAVGSGYSFPAGGGTGTVVAFIKHWNGRKWSVVSGPNVSATLHSVAAHAANDIWAVGVLYKQTSQTLIEHWNGKNWSVVASPNVGKGGNSLNSVAVVSASNVWAVGNMDVSTNNISTALIEHWDGQQWSIVPSPNLSLNDQLNGVTALSANNVWAVGSSYFADKQTSMSLIEHWDGQQWSIISSPNVDGEANNHLSAVTALSVDNIWAVGYSNGPTGQSLIEHWDGRIWSLVSSPSLVSSSSPNQNQLNGITALSASNIWVVGNMGDWTLTEHWDGHHWSIVPSPNADNQSRNMLLGVVAWSVDNIWAVGKSDSVGDLLTFWDGHQWNLRDNIPFAISYSLNSVSVLSANSVWAAGCFFDAVNQERTLSEHWDGRRWHVISSPNATSGAGANNVLRGIATVSASNVWEVGYATDLSGNSNPLVEHWDGKRWSIISIPKESDPANSELTSVAALSATDIWAVGSSGNSYVSEAQALIEHWDGKRWGIVPSPTITGIGFALYGVVALSPNNLWAVGSTAPNSSDTITTLTEHWDGHSWSIVPSMNVVGSADNRLDAVTAVSANNIWAVGASYSRNDKPALIEHWDGKHWSLVSNTGPKMGNELSSVIKLSVNDIWAVGSSSPGFFSWTLIEHWNGKRWSIISSPAFSPFGINSLWGIAALSANNLWAVGQSTVQNPLIEHWDGKQWTLVSALQVIRRRK